MGGACLANARLANQQDEPPAARERIFKVRTERGHFLLTPDEHSAREQGSSTYLFRRSLGRSRLSSIVFPDHLYNFAAGLEGGRTQCPTLHPQVIEETYILLLCQCVYEHLLYALFARRQDLCRTFDRGEPPIALRFCLNIKPGA
jgi:hypothetical protein